MPPDIVVVQRRGPVALFTLNRPDKLNALDYPLVDRLMAELDAAEARRKAIQEGYCSEGFFERTAKEEVARLAAEEAALAAQIEALMAEWEQLELEIAELGEV